MKWLICRESEGDYNWHLTKQEFKRFGQDREEWFVYATFCSECYHETSTEVLNKALFDYWKSLQPTNQTESEVTMLKFPTADEYPEGYEWFAYDRCGDAYFYKEQPELRERWNDFTSNDWVITPKFKISGTLENWKETLRQKPFTSFVGNEEISHPNYYTWHPAIECYRVTQHFLGNLAQAIQYIWRCGNPVATKGQSKEDRIKDLRKAIQFIEFEIERIEGE